MNSRTTFLLGCFATSVLIAPGQGAETSSNSLRGAQAYLQHCAACHGTTGDGNGPASVWLFPKPRNFSSGLFKIQSTPSGSLPTDEDLFQTITRGMPGSSMPSFTYLTEPDRHDLVSYVKYLTAEVGADGQRVNHFERAAGTAVQPVQVPPEPADTVEGLAKGKELFTKLACNTCHGETGAGDGPSAATLRDSWGIPIPPRDFNTGSFRGGHTGNDLYLRIHNGMAGTPMPPFGEGVITPEERWSVVHYIQSLRRKDIDINDFLIPNDGTVPVMKVASVPTDPMDDDWDSLDSVRVPVNPLWPEKDPIPAVAVRAVYDGKRIAFLCQWRDYAADGAPIRIEDFQDALALQFTLNGTIPFLGMGDKDNPVNIWQWKAGWQQEAEGMRADIESIYPSTHVDFYFQTNLLHRTAAAAGNLQALTQRKSPVEDANANGFGTLNSQSLGGQNVRGKGIWRDGHWSVVLLRDLRSDEQGDVKFSARKKVHVSFAVWDGQNRDRNGRKVVSNWYELNFLN